MALLPHQLRFLSSTIQAAVDVCPGYGVPPVVCVAQAVQESGWGKSPSGTHNYWGLKGSGDAGTVEIHTSEPSGAKGDGAKVPTVSSFASFSSAPAGMAAYCRKVTGLSGAVGKQFFGGSTLYHDRPAAFLIYVWAGGYTPSIGYVAAVSSVANSIADHAGELLQADPQTGQPYAPAWVAGVAKSWQGALARTGTEAQILAALQGADAGAARRALRAKLLPGGPMPDMGGGWWWLLAAAALAVS